jgi:hypothetical protein
MTGITREMIEAAKAAYWHEAHNGGGYSDKCYEAAISAALSSRSAEAGNPGILHLAVAAVLEAEKEFRANMSPEWEGDPLSDEIDGLRRVFSALSTPADIEPVASRWQFDEDGPWSFGVDAPNSKSFRFGKPGMIEPLYAAPPAEGQPVAWLRDGEMIPIQGCPLGAMWITDKDDPRGFPVYASPALAAPPADIEPVAWQWSGRAREDLPWSEWKEGRAPAVSSHGFDFRERPLYAAPVADRTASALATIRAMLIKLHVEGVLSEGQVAKATGLHRIAIRKMADALNNGDA